MKKKAAQPAQRKPRTDALRNRARLLEVAKRAFTLHGADASLDIHSGRQSSIDKTD